MQISLSTQPADRQRHKCLVLGFFSDEKPPRGTCGLVDWRLNGMISRALKEGQLTGAFGERAMIPYPGRIASDFLCLVGLGPIAEISLNRVYDAAYDIAAMTDKLKMRDFAFDLPGDNRSALTTAGLMEAMITGFFDYLSRDVDRLASVSVCLVTSADRLSDVARGIEQFNRNVKHVGSVDFSALEPHFA